MKSEKFEEIIRVALALDNYYKNNEIRDIVQFSQTWSSTALGFGGVGGDMLTSAITSVVFKQDGKIDVFFGRRKAYTIPKITQSFVDDLNKRYLRPVSESSVYME